MIPKKQATLSNEEERSTLPMHKGGRGTMKDLLNELRSLLAKYSHIPERVMYEELASEASAWEMRLQELAEEEEEN